MNKQLLTLTLLLIPILATAQHPKALGPLYSFSLTAGSTIPNSSSEKNILSSEIGAEFTLEWQMHAINYWTQFWNQPRFGIQLTYLHSAKAIAGHRLGIAATMRNPIWKSTKTQTSLTPPPGSSEIYWLMDAGLSLFTNPYERSHDATNQYIGSYLNCLFNIGLGYTLTLHDYSALSIEAKFGHSSNGYTLKPNKGLNYLLATVAYRLPRHNHDKQTTQMPQPYNRRLRSHLLYVSYAPGVVQSRYPSPTKDYYYAFTAQIGHLYYPNQCIGFGANLDIMYNYSHTEIMIQTYHKPATLPYLGLCANFEPRWGPMSVRLGIGYYLRKQPTITIPLYERLGIYFHFGHTFSQFVGISIKAHAAHADYIEFHFGLALRTKQH